MKITIEPLEFPLCVKEKLMKIPKISKLHIEFVNGKNINFDKKKKEKTINILKECYDNNLYNSKDLKEISKDTDSKIEINDFINKESLEKDYDIF